MFLNASAWELLDLLDFLSVLYWFCAGELELFRLLVFHDRGECSFSGGKLSSVGSSSKTLGRRFGFAAAFLYGDIVRHYAS